MLCQWCAHNKKAVHWAKPVVGPESAMCDDCLKRVGKKDEKSNYMAVPIEEGLKLGTGSGVQGTGCGT